MEKNKPKLALVYDRHGDLIEPTNPQLDRNDRAHAKDLLLCAAVRVHDGKLDPKHLESAARIWASYLTPAERAALVAQVQKGGRHG